MNVDSHQPEHASACQLSRKLRTATRIALNRSALSIMTMKILLLWVISRTASLNSFNCNFVLSPLRKRRWLTVKYFRNPTHWQSRIWSNATKIAIYICLPVFHGETNNLAPDGTEASGFWLWFARVTERMTGLFSHTKKSFPKDRQPAYKAEVLKTPRSIPARTQALAMIKSRFLFTPILYKFYV